MLALHAFPKGIHRPLNVFCIFYFIIRQLSIFAVNTSILGCWFPSAFEIRKQIFGERLSARKRPDFEHEPNFIVAMRSKVKPEHKWARLTKPIGILNLRYNLKKRNGKESRCARSDI